MKNFSTFELLRDFTSVTTSAMREPVAILHRRKPRFVLMTIEDYQRLARRVEDPRKAYGPGETPSDVAMILQHGLDRLIKDGGDGA